MRREKGNRHDDQIRTIQPRLDLVQETLQAQISTVDRNGRERQGAILSGIEAKFEPLKEDLVERDEGLLACIGQLREDLSPLRDDLEKAESTRETQHWTLLHSMQQQTAAIRPLHTEIASIQLTADQNFDTVFTKLDDNAAALDEVNKKVNTMGLILWDLKNQPAGLIPSSARKSILEQKRDDRSFPFPQIRDHEFCLDIQQLENKPLEVVPSVEQGHEEQSTTCRTTIESMKTSKDDVLTEEHKNELVAPPIEDESLGGDVAASWSFEACRDVVTEADIPTTSTPSSPSQIRPAQELLASQHNRAVVELLQVMVDKITALEERSRDGAAKVDKTSDLLHLEQGSATTILAHGLTPSTQRSSRRRHSRNMSHRKRSSYRVLETTPYHVPSETYDSSYSESHQYQTTSVQSNRSNLTTAAPYYVPSETYDPPPSELPQHTTPSTQVNVSGLTAAAVGLTIGLGTSTILPFLSKKSKAKKQVSHWYTGISTYLRLIVSRKPKQALTTTKSSRSSQASCLSSIVRPLMRILMKEASLPDLTRMVFGHLQCLPLCLERSTQAPYIDGMMAGSLESRMQWTTKMVLRHIVV